MVSNKSCRNQLLMKNLDILLYWYIRSICIENFLTTIELTKCGWSYTISWRDFFVIKVASKGHILTDTTSYHQLMWFLLIKSVLRGCIRQYLRTAIILLDQLISFSFSEHILTAYTFLLWCTVKDRTLVHDLTKS